MTACGDIIAPQAGQGASAGTCRQYSSSSSQIDFAGLPSSGTSCDADGIGRSGEGSVVGRCGGAAERGCIRESGGGNSPIGVKSSSESSESSAFGNKGIRTTCPQLGHFAFFPAAFGSAFNAFPQEHENLIFADMFPNGV